MNAKPEHPSAARQFGELIEMAPIAVMVQRDGRILCANAMCRQYLGVPRHADVVGTDALVVVPPHERERLQTRMASVQAGGGVGAMSTELVRSDGTTIPIDLTVSLVQLDGEPAIVALARDLTSEREMQRQLMIADRLATLGTLAAGVAHEINNPLAYVYLNIEFALDRVTEVALGTVVTDEVREALVEAREGASRVRLLVRDLNTFSRNDEDKPEPVELLSVIESALNIAFNEIRHRARVVKHYGRVPLVAASAARLGQVFLNLLMNAAQATPEGAVERNEIRISTDTDEIGRAIVTISDTGMGMTPEIQRRIFDPFFSTKPAGKGTGLGLSICQRIVTALRGEIRVESASGRGATFRVVLPPAHREATPAVRQALDHTNDPSGTILIVADDPLVQEALRRALRMHEIVAERSVKGALDRLAAGGRCDVILCDLVIPGMSGMNLYDELMKVDNALARRIIFLTGGRVSSAAQEFLHQVPNLRLEKPFKSDDLRALVRARLLR